MGLICGCCAEDQDDETLEFHKFSVVKAANGKTFP